MSFVPKPAKLGRFLTLFWVPTTVLENVLPVNNFPTDTLERDAARCEANLLMQKAAYPEHEVHHTLRSRKGCEAKRNDSLLNATKCRTPRAAD